MIKMGSTPVIYIITGLSNWLMVLWVHGGSGGFVGHVSDGFADPDLDEIVGHVFITYLGSIGP